MASSSSSNHSRLSEGWRPVEDFGQVPVYVYLRGLRQLASIFQRKVGIRVAAWIQEKTQTELSLEQAVLGSSFERQTPRLRAIGLFAANWLVGEWPTRFISMLRELDVKLSELLPPPEDRPYWLCHPDIEAAAPRQLPLEEAEIESARNALTRMLNWPVTKADAIAYMRQLIPPAVRPLRIAGTKKGRLKAAELWEAQNIKAKERLSWPKEPRVRTLYKAFRQPYENRPIEADIWRTTEDVQNLLMALRRVKQDIDD